ncbi:beta-N-acetylhexosaminidase [Leeia sp. TBRC 13508]|uniref:Beta-hexosaminidase n=1 Tax=Leeia speluncae TaxID=2884804 RepID=A0ABS8D239_9NEIS|nr:beta-N-acetylhexosaminidase [Leeia speluncae]MCB6182256.1 beta-N-acetylhexosaminidase [Leeia speluncae]
MTVVTQHIPLGPIIVDIASTELTSLERTRLKHPMVGGVILFARNFESIEQLIKLTAEIRAIRKPSLLISVDHEGGRVQRFKKGFTRIPAMSVFGELWAQDEYKAKTLAEKTGYVLAAELRASGVDFSFAPVLDLDFGRSSVIGNRAFHSNPQVVASIAKSVIRGMKLAGMHPCGKHFPGHGYVEVDSHVGIPSDDRGYEDIHSADIYPYRQLFDAGLTAIMPAHVIYSKVDAKPAGFSRVWLQEILRSRLGFDGVIISDALDMEGASFAGSTFTQRVATAIDAGCDLVLATNRPEDTDRMLEELKLPVNAVSLTRLARLHGEPDPHLTWEKLKNDIAFQATRLEVSALVGEKTDAMWGANVGE